MNQTAALLKVVKQELKKAGITYRDVAKHLSMSEANVKRLFASQSVALDRLEKICGLIQMELSDLFEIYKETRQRTTSLTLQQEEELVGNSQLMLVAMSVRNNLTLDDIVKSYQISEAECIKSLIQLDRLRVINLLPDNRIKLLVKEYFKWIPGGPVEKFFEQQIQRQFINSNFDNEGDLRLFQFGMLSNASNQILLNKLKNLASEFTETHRQDSRIPLAHRQNYGLLIAIRSWHPEFFKPFLEVSQGN